MTERFKFETSSPRIMKILLEQENYLRQQFNDDRAVWELVKLRVSQINQCAYCIDMHSKDALQLGETPERIYGLSAWKDMPIYSETEKNALEWAELITSGAPVSDEVYRHAANSLGEQVVADLTVAVNAINSWNRIAKTFKPEVGSYQPA